MYSVEIQPAEIARDGLAGYAGQFPRIRGIKFFSADYAEVFRSFFYEGQADFAQPFAGMNLLTSRAAFFIKNIFQVFKRNNR